MSILIEALAHVEEPKIADIATAGLGKSVNLALQITEIVHAVHHTDVTVYLPSVLVYHITLAPGDLQPRGFYCRFVDQRTADGVVPNRVPF